MLALLREISLRHWARSPLRSLLIVFGIALGVALYVATETTSASMLAAFSEIVARVAGRADLTIQGGGVGVPGDLVASVSEAPGVAHAASSLEVTTQAPDFNESLLILGVDFLGDLHFLPFAVKSGETRAIEDPLAFVNDPTALLVSARFAERHGLAKGSTLRLLTAEGIRDFHVRGVLEDSGPAASFGGQVAVMFLDAAQVTFARGTFVDRIDVAVKPGADAGVVRETITKLLGSGLTVDRPERLGARLRDLTEPLRVSLWLSGFTSLLVGAFLVYNAVGIAVVQRRREIGVLRALGITRGKTVVLFCLEAGLLAIPGVALGLVIASTLARYSAAQALDTVNTLYVSVGTVPPKITLGLALRGALAGVVTAVGAAVWPARRGAALDPAIVLRGSSAVERAPLPYWRLAAAGAACLALSWLPSLRGTIRGGATSLTLVVVGAALATPAVVVLIHAAVVRAVEATLGVPARLGLDYVERTLGRSSVNVLALMVAVSMSVSVGGWLSSFEQSLGSWFEQMSAADLSVTAGSPLLDRRHVLLSAGAAERIAKVPGVDRVQPFRIIDQEARGKTFRLVATDTEVFLSEATRRGKAWPVVEGAPLRPGDLSGSPRILLGESAARRLDLHAGDHFALHATRGDVVFEVRAVIVDYTSERGAGFIDRKQFLEHWGDDAVDAVSVYASAGASVDAVADGVRQALGGGPSVFVTKTATLRKNLLDSLHNTFSYSRAVEIVTLFIALMGVVGTMVAAVLDRTREIGMLRAIGATSRQVAVAIVVEAGFLGFCAVVAGVGLGVLECLLFLKTLLQADTGWHLDFVFPWASTARISSLVVATSALAGGLPALRAARADVTSAVLYE
jgi:putative ABC transport system permease protein